MKKEYLLIATLFITLKIYATPQCSDILIWKGDTLRLFSNPLYTREDYNALNIKISDEINRQVEEAELSSSCWRGYRVEWVIQNDSLYLNEIYYWLDQNVKVNLINIFPQLGENQKIFASWVYGYLYVPQGECIQYIHFGYESIFELETVLSIERGIFKNYEKYQNRIVRKSKFYNNFSLDDYPRFIYGNINWNNLPNLTDKTYQVFIGVQPNENGQFESIIEEYTYLIDNSNFEIITDLDNIFIQEGIRIAKLIPDWDVIYQRGKIKDAGLNIIFSETYRDKYAQLTNQHYVHDRTLNHQPSTRNNKP